MTTFSQVEPVPTGPPGFAPTTRSERLVGIDFARGLALLGILFVNAQSFFGPLAALAEPAYLSRLAPADRVAALLVVSIFYTKFISIFSILFGYGLFGQIERAADAGRSPITFTLRRLGALALFGLVHALLLWYGDILFIYACLGIGLLLARGARARTLLIVAGCLLVFALLLRVGLESLGATFGETANPRALAEGGPRGRDALLASRFNPGSPVWIEAETTAYRDGPWADAQLFRTVEWLFVVVTALIFQGWLSLGWFFLGAALWRVRFFAPEQEPLRWRVFVVCLPLGLAFEGLAAWFLWGFPPGSRWGWASGHILQQFGLFFLPMGYLCGFALLADRLPPAVRGPVASAGRMSLTVYLLETVLATALAYHWGLGLFGRVGPALQAPIVLGIWVVLVAFSHAWLARFDQGPMERLWRRLGYGAAR